MAAKDCLDPVVLIFLYTFFSILHKTFLSLTITSLSLFTFFFEVASWYRNLTFYSLTKPHSTYGSRSQTAMMLSYFLPYHLKIQLLFFWLTITTNTDVVKHFFICSGFSSLYFDKQSNTCSRCSNIGNNAITLLPQRRDVWKIVKLLRETFARIHLKKTAVLFSVQCLPANTQTNRFKVRTNWPNFLFDYKVNIHHNFYNTWKHACNPSKQFRAIQRKKKKRPPA